MKSYTFSFEKLEVWKEAKEYVSEIYKITASFPHIEQFGLTAQIRRAAVSVCSNIAEGDGRFSVKDQLRFFSLAWSSLMEVFNQLIIAHDLGYISRDELENFRSRTSSLANKLNALYNYRKKRLRASNKTSYLNHSKVGIKMAKPLVSDELWAIIEPLLPPEPPKPKGGRPRIPDRKVLTGILFVLKSGIPWEMLPQEMGCGSGMTCWRRLRQWHEAGVWERLHKVLLDHLGEADKLDWSRAAVDAQSIPAPKGGTTPARIRRIAANRARSGILW